MSSWVKTLVVLALVVPMTAYVAGSLVSSSSYEPSDRRPVIIQDAPSRESDRVRETTGAPTATSPSARPAPTRSPSGPGTGRGTRQPPPSGTVDDDDDDDDDGPEEDDDGDGDDDGDDD